MSQIANLPMEFNNPKESVDCCKSEKRYYDYLNERLNFILKQRTQIVTLTVRCKISPF